MSEIAGDIHDEARSAWRRYFRALDPVRPDLYRYCRRLTGDLWDAEDLVSETLVRGFAALGAVEPRIANPRAYLLRIATNAWLELQRRAAAQARALAEAPPDIVAANAPGDVADAGAKMLQRLAPRERAAVVLKDVFDFTLEETAEVLGSSVGAVKAALSRGRARLQADIPVRAERPRPDPRVLAAFADAFHARDLGALLALMLDEAEIDMPGVDVETGRAAFERAGGWFHHNLYGIPEMNLPPAAWRWEVAEFDGEPLMLVVQPEPRTLMSVMRFETDDGRIARIRVYAFKPDAVREVAAALGLPAGFAMYSFPFAALTPGT